MAGSSDATGRVDDWTSGCGHESTTPARRRHGGESRWWGRAGRGGGRQRGAVPTSAESERGDVPGWVLVTLMTAGLVIALWAIAGPALQGVFESAIAQVTGSHP